MGENRGQQIRVVIVGHVDHGKSTLIGRLLYDTDSLPPGKKEEIEAMSTRRGMEMEWSFLLDSFQAERDQAITIDTTQIWFKTDLRDYVIIDAPGHREFLKNMISGGAAADAAILVVDAKEGVQEQTRRHAYLLHLLGLKQIAVVVNKMDMVDFDAKHFAKVSKEIEEYLSDIGVIPSVIIPISARHGDMIATRGEQADWYQGETLLESLDSFHPPLMPVEKPLRFPVQDVYRFDEQRILVGRVETGVIRTGDKLLFSPTDEMATVTSIKVWPDNEIKVEASAGECIGVTLDKPIFAERGHLASHKVDPPMLSNVFRLNLFWLGKKPFKIGHSYKMRLNTREIAVSVQSIDRVIDTDNLKKAKDKIEVERNDVAEVTLRSHEVQAVDSYVDNAATGRVVIYDKYDVVGGGTLNMEQYPDQRRGALSPKSDNIYKVDHKVDADARSLRHGHKGGIFWFTGLSGAGKSTLAMAVEKELFERGYMTYVLDGDNVRHGLNADLGFSPDDRAENIRRIGHVAALMADAGMVTVTAFISPYRVDRQRAREAAPNAFHEIHVKADLSTCEERDPKGLYKKARKGEIKEFTGISSPYEAPDNPELVVDTQNNDIETCVGQVVRYIESIIRVSANDEKKLQGSVA